jgi:hypothetical protein
VSSSVLAERIFGVMEVGLRVVRGPDWKWGTQDEGEGHVGTVVEIGRVSAFNFHRREYSSFA